MMTRCAKCGLPIEAQDLVEVDNPDDPLQPLHYHLGTLPTPSHHWMKNLKN